MTSLHPSRLGYYDEPTEQAIYLAPLPDGEISRLEGPARAIWIGADGAENVHEVAQRVAPYFNVTADQIEADVSEFISQLIAGALLEEVMDLKDAR